MHYCLLKIYCGDGIIGVMNRLPRYEEAVIPIEKFTQYSLNPEASHDKAVAFEKALGYKKGNVNALIDDIRRNLPNYEAISKGDLGHGMRYEIVMILTGPNGKTARVLTAWIDDKRNGQMRLINAYVDKRKGGQGND